MALVINDRVKVTSTTTGTGAVALGAAQTGFESFADGIGNNNTTYYTIFNQGTAEFEVLIQTTQLISLQEIKMYFVHCQQVKQCI